MQNSEIVDGPSANRIVQRPTAACAGWPLSSLLQSNLAKRKRANLKLDTSPAARSCRLAVRRRRTPPAFVHRHVAAAHIAAPGQQRGWKNVREGEKRVREPHLIPLPIRHPNASRVVVISGISRPGHATPTTRESAAAVHTRHTVASTLDTSCTEKSSETGHICQSVPSLPPPFTSRVLTHAACLEKRASLQTYH